MRGFTMDFGSYNRSATGISSTIIEVSVTFLAVGVNTFPKYDSHYHDFWNNHLNKISYYLCFKQNEDCTREYKSLDLLNGHQWFWSFGQGKVRSVCQVLFITFILTLNNWKNICDCIRLSSVVLESGLSNLASLEFSIVFVK